MDVFKKTNLWSNNFYLILNSLPMYTLIACGLCYEMFVGNILLKLKNQIKEKNAVYRSSEGQNKSL